MSLLDNNTSIYLTVTADTKLFRPLNADTTSLWVHAIQAIPDVRKYTTILCQDRQCVACNVIDPLWGKLTPREQTNKAKQPVHFPKRLIHFLPIYDYTSKSVKVLRGGAGTYEGMSTWLTSLPKERRDLQRCDWSISKAGTGLMTKYALVRSDETKFDLTTAMVDEAKAIIESCIKDLTVTNDEFKLLIVGNA